MTAPGRRNESAATRPRRRREVDVRAILARGQEPLTYILPAVSATEAADELLVVSPFLPSPLIERLRSEGFEARPARQGDGSWQTLFWRANSP